MLRPASLALVLSALSALPAQDLPKSTGAWHGFARSDFTVDGRRCILVMPKTPAKGRPWIWRARFFGHQPQLDTALLRRGYHVAYCDVAGLFGSPRAVGHWDAFYRALTTRFDMAEKPALEGMSRGGLIIHNWAKANPTKVACIYGDAPVCDIRSWPGGKGTGKGSRGDWQRCLAEFDLTEETAIAFTGNAFDGLEALARAKVPILHVLGAADRVVPPKENSAVLVQRYRALGGDIQVIAKPGVGHHPHALRDPRPLLEFIVSRCRAAGADQTKPRRFDGNLALRRGIRNAHSVFSGKKRGHVAFLGGSITEMNGYRPRVCAILERRFPETKFTFTDAGIASTCSTTGAFRLHHDVLAKGPVDLFFVEFAVNDDQDAANSRAACIRGLEGIVRQVRSHNPMADIVVLFFVNPRIRDTLLRGETPPTVASHDAVAVHYGVPTVHVAREVADRIVRGEMTWREFGGTHPKPPGNALAAEMVGALFERGWTGPRLVAPASHTSPKPLDGASYDRGGFVSPDRAQRDQEWTFGVPAWKKLRGSKRARFTSTKLLHATTAGAALTLRFDGNAVGAYVLAGPDAGTLEGTIDGEPFAPVDLYHRFSRGLHYPRTVLFGAGLSDGPHTLQLRISDTTSSKGHAARILQFVVNGRAR